MHPRLTLSICYLAFTLPLSVQVYEPVFVHPVDVDDVYQIEDPTHAQASHGTLINFPHTFEIHAEAPFTLFTEILVPNIDSSINNISGVIIKEDEKTGRVTDVARLEVKEASWETQFERLSGDTYRRGPQFTKELGPGVYRIEVHTPDNKEKYALRVGTREKSTIGYVERIRRIAGIKEFFEKSQLRIVESPSVYIPLLCIALILGAVWYLERRKRRCATTT